MILADVLRVTRILIYIFSIIILITNINTKNKKLLRNSSIISKNFIIYLFVTIFILPDFIGIDLGWASLIIFPIALIDVIILIINIAISKKKLNKNDLNEKDNKLIKFYYIVMIVFPVVFIVISFISELIVLNNSNLLVTFNYQNGIIESKDTRFAIGENFCKEISINEKFVKKSFKINEYINYNIKYNEKINEYSITSYDDPNLENIDVEIAKKIFEDIEVNNNERKRHNASLIKIIGTDYYIIRHCISHYDNQSGGSVIAEYVYQGINKINNINSIGSIEDVFVFYINHI